MFKEAYILGYMEKLNGSRLREMARMGALSDDLIRSLQAKKMLPSSAKVIKGIRKGSLKILRQMGQTKFPYNRKTRVPTRTEGVLDAASKKSEKLEDIKNLFRFQFNIFGSPPKTTTPEKTVSLMAGIANVPKGKLLKSKPVFAAIAERHEVDELRKVRSLLDRDRIIRQALWEKHMAKQPYSVRKFRDEQMEEMARNFYSPKLKDYPKKFGKRLKWSKRFQHFDPQILVQEAGNLAYFPDVRDTFRKARIAEGTLKTLPKMVKPESIPSHYRTTGGRPIK